MLMTLTRKQPVAIAIALVAVIGAAVSSAQDFPPSGPLVVRFIGTLQSFDEKKSYELNTLTMNIEAKQKWLYNVTRVDTLTGTDPGTMLLDRIFPPELQL